jgi:hypothetical protein
MIINMMMLHHKFDILIYVHGSGICVCSFTEDILRKSWSVAVVSKSNDARKCIQI